MPPNASSIYNNSLIMYFDVFIIITINSIHKYHSPEWYRVYYYTRKRPN
ncbi:hypothetical protein VP150E351_P0012 [Vibrio phage 150E35-1]|nr:hypothetical protein VP150E351_P0012 [Vibrio phage 150E35-1]